jgi:hypothetical protein
MQDLQQSTDINNFDQTEEVFKQEFIEGVAEQFEGEELEGIKAEDFAAMVAEIASGFIQGVPQDEIELFKIRYVAFTSPMLKLAGFETLTKGIGIDGIVEKYPFIGVILCAGITVIGIKILMPKPKPKIEQDYEEVLEYEQ